jgi:hypothetical protein
LILNLVGAPTDTAHFRRTEALPFVVSLIADAVARWQRQNARRRRRDDDDDGSVGAWT